MVEVVLSRRAVPYSPRIEIHGIEKHVDGHGAFFKVYGQMKIASSELVTAYELKLKTLHTLVLTPETPLPTQRYAAKQMIRSKGLLNNDASIDIYDMAGTPITAGAGPNDGSVWLSFIATGE